MTGLARKGRLLGVIGVIALGSLVFTGAQGFAQDPPGDNGTVKIDGIDFDVHPNNEPHVGCVFQVDFYGFDEGPYDARVRFFAIPPTGTRVLLESDKVFIGEDPHDDGGSIPGLDAEATYDLAAALKSFMAHPQQGYHIKLVVNAPGSIGDDKKHKVFWVEECAYGSPS